MEVIGFIWVRTKLLGASWTSGLSGSVQLQNCAAPSERWSTTAALCSSVRGGRARGKLLLSAEGRDFLSGPRQTVRVCLTEWRSDVMSSLPEQSVWKGVGAAAANGGAASGGARLFCPHLQPISEQRCGCAVWTAEGRGAGRARGSSSTADRTTAAEGSGGPRSCPSDSLNIFTLKLKQRDFSAFVYIIQGPNNNKKNI